MANFKKKDLKKELDTWFSRYIRLRDDGVCCSCGNRAYWKTMQNGHFVSRSYLATRWDEENNHCQCVGCNIFRHGNMTEYAEFMINKYGVNKIAELNKKKEKIVKLTKGWYEEKIEYYKSKVEDMEVDYIL